MQRLALFDLDNTLVDRRRTVEAWIDAFCEEHRLGSDAAVAFRDSLARRAYASDFVTLQERFKLAETPEELWRRYCEDIADSVTCRPEVLTGLDRLRAEGWAVAVVTNGAGDIQRAKLERSGIADRIDAYCISGDLGTRKPDPLPFLEAAKLCGLDLISGGWMVGDSPVNDVVGGRAAGLRTIWVHNQQTWPGEQPMSDVVVSDALAAIGHLMGLEKSST